MNVPLPQGDLRHGKSVHRMQCGLYWPATSAVWGRIGLGYESISHLIFLDWDNYLQFPAENDSSGALEATSKGVMRCVFLVQAIMSASFIDYKISSLC